MSRGGSLRPGEPSPEAAGWGVLVTWVPQPCGCAGFRRPGDEASSLHLPRTCPCPAPRAAETHLLLPRGMALSNEAM